MGRQRGAPSLYDMGELLLALRLRLCAQRLLTAGERDGSPVVFSACGGGAGFMDGPGKLSAFARAGQAFGGAADRSGGRTPLSLPSDGGEHLLPIWWGDLPNAARSALPVLGVLGYGVFAAFLTGDLETARPGRNWWVLWSTGGCALLALSQAVVIGNLGPALAGQLTAPSSRWRRAWGWRGIPACGEHRCSGLDLRRPDADGTVDLRHLAGRRRSEPQTETETGGDCRSTHSCGIGDRGLSRRHLRGGGWARDRTVGQSDGRSRSSGVGPSD